MRLELRDNALITSIVAVLNLPDTSFGCLRTWVLHPINKENKAEKCNVTGISNVSPNPRTPACSSFLSGKHFLRRVFFSGN